MMCADVFDDFVVSGVLWEQWPNQTHVIIPKKVFGEHIYVTNGPGVHAEKRALEKIKTLLKNGENATDGKIQMYMNYSPCQACAELIIHFGNYFEKTYTIEIVFSALYYTARPSLQKRGYTTPKKWIYYSEEIHRQYENENGLYHMYALKDQGLVIRTMNADDWAFLAKEMDVSDNDTRAIMMKRGAEDRFMKEDFDDILKRSEFLQTMAFSGLEEQTEDEIAHMDSNVTTNADQLGSPGSLDRAKRILKFDAPVADSSSDSDFEFDLHIRSNEPCAVVKAGPLPPNVNTAQNAANK
jgi:hypothetical protein